VGIVSPDVIEFARKASRAGDDVRLRVGPDGFHVYVLGVPTIPEAEAALDHSALHLGDSHPGVSRPVSRPVSRLR
jgi:acetyl-hydrolase